MGIFKRSENSWMCQFTTSEVKIFLVFCYLLAFFVILWISISHQISKHDETAIQIGTYIRCSANGIRDGLDCEQYRKNFEEISIPCLIVMYLILMSFLNVSNLPLIIEYKSMKRVILSTLGFDTSVKETEVPSHSSSHAPSRIQHT